MTYIRLSPRPAARGGRSAQEKGAARASHQAGTARQCTRLIRNEKKKKGAKPKTKKNVKVERSTSRWEGRGAGV
jgi:hypothetical protein